jgi:hypothetical protein
MKRIIYKTDEGMAIIVPSPNWAGTLEELASKDVPSGSEYWVVEDTDLPSDKTYRNAWEVTDGVVSVNSTKAAAMDAEVAAEAAAEAETESKLEALGLTKADLTALLR